MAKILRQSTSRSHLLAASVGKKLREVRVQQGLTQADLEKATGLMRSHISRIENGRRAPSIETVQRLAAALKVPLYVLFYPGTREPAHPAGRRQDGAKDPFLEELKAAILRLSQLNRRVVLATARKMARRASAVRKPRG